MAVDERQQQAQTQQKQDVGAQVAVALAAGGAVVASLGPSAAGAVTVAQGTKLTAQAIGELTEQIVESMRRFTVGQATDATDAALVQLERRYPERGPDELAKLAAEERDREKVFMAKMEARLRRDLARVLALEDPAKRRDRLQTILDRERRYVTLREQAIHDRMQARAEMLAVKDASPGGAYWALSNDVMSHTPDCVALAGKFWPWSVIEAVGPPPRHFGCRCELYTKDDAVRLGMIRPDQAEGIVPADALARAKKLLRDAELVEASVSKAEWREWLSLLAEGAEHSGAMIALYPDAATAAQLAVGSEPAHDLHVTLKFLGEDHEELGEPMKARLRRAVALFAQRELPLTGEADGVDTFAGDDDEYPVFARVDVPGIDGFRQRLVDALPDGVMEDTFPDFKPHMTLAYVPQGQDHGLDPPQVPLRFHHVDLVFGGTRERYELGTNLAEPEFRKMQESLPEVIEADTSRDFPQGYVVETQRIRANKEKPEASKRHAFKRAEWTHPNGHPRCLVCGDEERVGGVCNGEPTRAEAEAWVARHNAEDEKLGMKSSYYVDKRGRIMCDLGEGRVELAEAAWARRYPKGVEHGGEFMPKMGGDPGRHLLSAAKKALLSRLATPQTAKEALRAGGGRHYGIEGRRVFVPEARAFHRVVNGRTYASPPFSTRLYRDGRPFEGGAIREKTGDLATPQGKPDERVLDARAGKELDALGRVHAALATGDGAVPPVHEGQDGHEALTALDHAGFRKVSERKDADGREQFWTAPDRSSTLRVLLGDDGKVLESEWTPRAPAAPARLSTTAPRTWGEFAADFQAVAQQLARRHGGHALTGQVRTDATSTDLLDHAGEHRWDGDVNLGRDFAASILGIAASRQLGKPLTDAQKRDGWLSYQTAAHEALHAAGNVGGQHADPHLLALNEALVEELSHGEAHRWLTTQGQHDVARWRTDNPLSEAGLGHYRAFRRGLADVLDRAKVPPERREQYMRELFFHTPPREWLPTVGRSVAEATGDTPRKGEAWARKAFEQDEPKHADFAPILPSPGVPSMEAREPYRAAGANVRVGDRLTYRTLTVDEPSGETRRESREGTVREMHPLPSGGWAAELDNGDAVIGKEVTRVRTAEGLPASGRPPRPHGAELDAARINGDAVKAGTVVRYDGGAGFQRAEVTRLLRGGRSWSLEGRTVGGDRPGTPVVLTAGSAPNLDAVGHAGTAAGGPPPGEVAAPTLDDLMDVGRWFKLPPGTRIARTDDLVPERLDPPDKVALARRLMHDAALGLREKRGPLTVRRAKDGRLVVTNGKATLAAARSMGIDRLPVAGDGLGAPALFDERGGESHVFKPGEKTKAGLVGGPSLIAAKKMPEFKDTPSLAPGSGPSYQEALAHYRGSGEPARSAGVVVVEPDGRVWTFEPKGHFGGYSRTLSKGRVDAGESEQQAALRELYEETGLVGRVTGDVGWYAGSTTMTHYFLAERTGGAPWGHDGKETATVRLEPAEVAHAALTRRDQLALEDAGVVSKHGGYGGWGMGFKGTKDSKGSKGSKKPMEPELDDSGLVTLKGSAGGSNGARFGEDAEGRKWLVKGYRGDEDRVATELLANAIYRKLGVKVPEAGSLSVHGKAAVAYPLVDGVPGGYKSGIRVDRPSSTLARDFMADALLANWDVVGLEHDNLLWPEGTTQETLTPETEATRLDQGGTLRFRAMGGLKPFGPVPSEVWTMASPAGGQAHGTMALSPELKREGARQIAERLTDGAIDGLVDVAPFRDEKMRGEVRAALKARRDWMADYAAGKVSEPKPAEGARARKLLAKGQAQLDVPPEGEAALEAWGKGWGEVVNAHLTSGGKKEEASKEVRFLVRELDELTRRTRTGADATVWAATAEGAEPDGGWETLVGRSISHPGFLGAATDRRSAEGQGGALVRILLPKGSRALYVHGVPGADTSSWPAQPELLMPRGQRLKVVASSVERGRTVLDVVPAR